MTLADLTATIAAKATDYDRMLAEKALARVAPDDGQAFDMLAGLVTYKSAKEVPVVVELAANVVMSGPIRGEHLRAAISHHYGTEGILILQHSMRHG